MEVEKWNDFSSEVKEQVEGRTLVILSGRKVKFEDKTARLQQMYFEVLRMQKYLLAWFKVRITFISIIIITIVFIFSTFIGRRIDPVL